MAAPAVKIGCILVFVVTLVRAGLPQVTTVPLLSPCLVLIDSSFHATTTTTAPTIPTAPTPMPWLCLWDDDDYDVIDYTDYDVIDYTLCFSGLLQTLCVLVRCIFRKLSGVDIINVLVGFERAVTEMQVGAAVGTRSETLF